MRRRRPQAHGVELNLAAMLDMAFQLLTFFILTFKPAPVEGQLSLHLPPAQPLSQPNATAIAGSNPNNHDHAIGLNTLTISVFPDAGGHIATMAIDQVRVGDLTLLDRELRRFFADPDLVFDQVIVQVGATLRYDELMKVMEVCARQKLRSGKPLSKLSFVELPLAPAAGK